MTTNEDIQFLEKSVVEKKIEEIMEVLRPFLSVSEEAPLHAEKSQDELLNMGFSGQLSKSEFDKIVAWQNSKKESIEVKIEKMLQDLAIISKKRKSTSSIADNAPSRKQTQNMFLMEKLEIPYEEKIHDGIISKIISSNNLNGVSFRANNSSPEEFFNAMVGLCKNEAELKKIIKKSVEESKK